VRRVVVVSLAPVVALVALIGACTPPAAPSPSRASSSSFALPPPPSASAAASGARPTDATPAGPRVVQVGASADHTCALIEDGTVRCWGANGVGQVGDGTFENRPAPTVVLDANGGPLRGVAQIAVGKAHACALMKDGTMRCWGGNYRGQQGSADKHSVKTAREVAGIANVAEIAAGGEETCARTGDAHRGRRSVERRRVDLRVSARVRDSPRRNGVVLERRRVAGRDPERHARARSVPRVEHRVRA
jgi:hypothetical protein